MKARRIIAAALGAASLAGAAGAGLLPAAQASSNLAPNPSFELAAAPVFPAAQPLLPDGWAFEGAAGLFDYATEDCVNVGLGCRDAFDGKRFVQISDPLSAKRRECQQTQCVDNPANAAKDAARTYYSVTPHWRTASPVAVAGGTTYHFTYYTRWDLVTKNAGIGPVSMVRWVDANGVPLSVSAGPGDVSTTDTGPPWHKLSGTVTAPAAARGAILLLGHGDDLFISAVQFDKVCFAALSGSPC